MWIRIADPQRAELHLRPESRDALQWLFTCFAHDRRRVLRQKPLLHCFAAADARADGDLIGIGGWMVTAHRCAWFAEQWHASEIRAVWPHLSEAPQRYIACFETLAQLALAMTAQRGLGAQQWTFSLPAASDNTAAEAQTEKLWSTAEPLRQLSEAHSSLGSKAPHRAACDTPSRGTQCMGRRAQQRKAATLSASHVRPR